MSGKSNKPTGAKGATGKKSRKQKSTRQNANALSVNPMKLGQPTEYKRVMKGARGTGLSRCAEMYCKALVNPFGEFDELPCVPCAPSDMTYKFRHVLRGTLSTSSTTGCGFLMWSPQCAANDVNCIFLSVPTFTGTNYAASGVGVNAIPKGTLPYPKVAFSNATGFAGARLVSSGLRIKNTTAPLYKQGSIMANRLSSGVALNNTTPAALQLSLETVKEEASRNGWFNWNYIPQDQEDFDFPDAALDYSTSVKSYANFGVFISGASLTNVSTFDWEIVEFWEFVSNNPSYSVPSLTKTHADSVGLDRVVEAVSVPVQSLNLKDMARSTSENIVDSMAHSDSAAKTVEDLLGLAGLALPAINAIVGSLTSMVLK